MLCVAVESMPCVHNVVVESFPPKMGVYTGVKK